MKKSLGILFCALFLLPPVLLRAIDSMGNIYEIIAEDGARAAVPAIEQGMESRFAIFNRLFRFDPELLASPLRVRVFAGRGAYDSYVFERLGFLAPSAVYLHYGNDASRELAICLENGGEDAILSHQAFIQFLRGFIPNPPAWLLEGFGIYFSSIRINPLGFAEYEENLLWLETVKNQKAAIPAPAALIAYGLPENPASGGVQFGSEPSSTVDFRVSSWALVSFLLSGSRDYYRTLTDSFLFLSPFADTAGNTLAVLRRFSLQNDMEELDRDFRNYLDSRKTFRELMEDGQKAYAQRDFMNAELSFLTARGQRPSDYAPYYYLGLISYDEKNHFLAEQYYRDSLERGADAALVNYALGNNSAAAGRYSEAAEYLRKAAALDPARYRSRADNLLSRIGQ